MSVHSLPKSAKNRFYAQIERDSYETKRLVKYLRQKQIDGLRLENGYIEKAVDVAVDFIKTKVAPAMRDSGIDTWLESVSSISRLTDKNIELSLACHKKLTDLFKKITGIDKRSLASKYLHFHRPQAFFIFDSVANTNIRARLRDKKIRHSYPKGYDNEYSSFVTRCVYYRDNYFEEKIGGLATPRKLDMELLGY